MNADKVEELRQLLNNYSEICAKLDRLDMILGTDRNNAAMRNAGGFLISPELYYSIYEQIKAEYLTFRKELESQIK